MKYKILNNTVNISRSYMESYVKDGQVVLDATVGNGNDTLLLARKVGDTGKVYGFDIQARALEKARKTLKKNNLFKRVDLINDSHEDLRKYISCKLDFIIYNLGYLPSGDKTIITRAKSTVKSVEDSLYLLKENGLLLINSYIGHDGGLEENKEIEDILEKLDQKEYNVLKNNFLNQKNNPPILYIIERASTI